MIERGRTILWQTCPNCAEVVKFDSADEFEVQHVCPPEPNLSVMQHIQYKRVPQIVPPEE